MFSQIRAIRALQNGRLKAPEGLCVRKGSDFHAAFVPQIKGRPPQPSQQRFGGKTAIPPKPGPALVVGRSFNLSSFFLWLRAGRRVERE